MKCRECGAWSEVKETRKIYGEQVTRRGRVCANGHSFSSYEVSAELFEKTMPHIDASGLSGREAGELRRRIKELKRNEHERN